MESAQEPIVEIPKSRVKMLTHAFYLENRGKASEAWIKEFVIREMGFELAKKLAEFQKFSWEDTPQGPLIKATIEVIVPPTPEHPWPCPA